MSSVSFFPFSTQSSAVGIGVQVVLAGNFLDATQAISVPLNEYWIFTFPTLFVQTAAGSGTFKAFLLDSSSTNILNGPDRSGNGTVPYDMQSIILQPGQSYTVVFRMTAAPLQNIQGGGNVAWKADKFKGQLI